MPKPPRLLPACCLLGLLCALAGPASAMPLPERFSAKFSVAIDGIPVGRARWSVEPMAGGRYLFRSVTKASGLASLFYSGERRERSIWTYTGEGIRPLEYRYRQSDRHRRDVDIRFDWEDGTAHTTAKGRTWQMPIRPGTLDKLNYLLALMQDLSRGRTDLSYTVADGGKLKSYSGRVVGRERVRTDLGTFETLKVHRPGDKRETTLWCAPALRFLPVQVVHKQRSGEVGRMKILRVEGLGDSRR